jgi:hypothetical protein
VPKGWGGTKGKNVTQTAGGKSDKKRVQGGKEVRKIILRKCEGADKIVHDFNGCQESKYSTQEIDPLCHGERAAPSIVGAPGGKLERKTAKKLLLPVFSAAFRLMHRCACFLCV